MPIITYAELNTLLGLNDTKETECELLIPIIQDKIVEYCNNNFVDTTKQVQSNKISIVYEVDTSYIRTDDPDIDFTEVFSAGNDISVIGSLSSNDGIYNITSLTAQEIVLNNAEVTNELNSNDTTMFTITRVKFPTGIKADVARLIHKYLTTQGAIVQSESLPGGYSVTYKTDESQMTPFNKYRKPYR